MSEELLHATGTNDVDVNKPVDLTTQREFGSYLREARLAAGLVTADVADRLKLSEEIIKSLENSRIDLLPAAAFTQGYIKAYAKLLKISPDEVMRAYDVMVPNKVAALNLNTGLPAEHSSRDGIVKITSYVLVAMAFILFVFWIQQSGFELSGNLVSGQAVEEQPPVEAAEPDMYPDSVLSGESNAIPTTSLTNNLQTQGQPVIAADIKPVQPAKTLTGVLPVEKKVEVKPENRISPRPAIVSNDVTPAIDDKNEVTAGDDIMKLQATSESWAEVQDADNNRLFYSLLKEGSSYAIKGRAPFRIFLGNAPAVSIEVNSQQVDISRYVRQNKIAHVKISSRASTQSGGPRTNVNQVVDQFVPDTTGTNKTE
jgi:cytoskeleton protein RodZ